MATPLISIVLPTYNGARYLKKSVDSCLAQTFRDFELIIVNDCSTDDTGQIADGYSETDARVRVIHNTFNKKLPLSLNTGFEEARGRYHTWTSDDNYFAPEALDVLVREFAAHSETDLVYTDYTLIDDQDRVTGIRKFNNIYDGFTEWLGCGACFLYKSEIFFANKGYNPGAFLIEDYDFFMRAFLKFNFSYLPRYDLYFYREHESSLTSTQGDVVNDLAKIMIERQLSGLEKKLPKEQLMLLYRKFAVFNAVRKNNTKKYRLYLEKVWSFSRWQAVVVVFYVPAMKLMHTVTVSAAGMAALLGFPFSKKKNRP
ncbi:MAG TPA: glycosyltransferase family A protein [Puia sp.]|jgi:glycosyltransferase involved in cell wall biosynthesis|nr:glycosyltransferase family A protein [Puia sp.]